MSAMTVLLASPKIGLKSPEKRVMGTAHANDFTKPNPYIAAADKKRLRTIIILRPTRSKKYPPMNCERMPHNAKSVMRSPICVIGKGGLTMLSSVKKSVRKGRMIAPPSEVMSVPAKRTQKRQANPLACCKRSLTSVIGCILSLCAR